MTWRTDGLLWPCTGPTNWSGRWIAPPDITTHQSAYFLARKRFTRDDDRPCPPLHIAAESMYLLYVNGVEIGRGPVRGTHAVNFFDSYDISSRLTRGENWLAVAVHCPNMRTFKHSPAQPGVLAQLHDGSIATDQTWQVRISPAHRPDAPTYTYQIGRMEWKDHRAEPIGWQTGRDDGLWQMPALLCPDEKLAAAALHARDIPALAVERHGAVTIPLAVTTPALEDASDLRVAHRMTHEGHLPLSSPLDMARLLHDDPKPVTVLPPADGRGVALILDFGRQINGGFELDIDTPAGTVFDIGYQEQLCEGRLDVEIGDYTFADRYITRGGRQRVGNEFSERGFRMVQLVFRDFHQPIHLHRIAAVNYRYPYKDRASFAASDNGLNRLWSICGETLRACTTDTIVDCPWRENALWLNDLIVAALTSMQMFGDPRIVKRCVRLAVSQVRADGLFPGVVPVGQAPGTTVQASCDRLTLTAGNLTFPQVLEDYLLYAGDEATVASLAELMLPMLARFEAWEGEDGLCRPPKQIWNFIDWSYPADMDNRVTCGLEWLRVLALDTTARLLKRLDPNRDTRPLTEKADRLVTAIDRRFWDRRLGCYVEGIDDSAGRPLATQLTQSFAILSERLSRQRNQVLGEALWRDELLVPELFMHHYVLRALVATDQASAAMDRIRRYWFPIIESGSPTIWEMGVHTLGKAAFGGAGSLCHGFSTTPVDFMQGVVLGVRPTAAGFARCSFAPQAVGLDNAAGRIPTPSGDLQVAWQRTGDIIQATLTVPPNTTVDLPHEVSLGEGTHQLTLTIPHIAPSPRHRLILTGAM